MDYDTFTKAQEIHVELNNLQNLADTITNCSYETSPSRSLCVLAITEGEDYDHPAMYNILNRCQVSKEVRDALLEVVGKFIKKKQEEFDSL